MYFSFTFAYTLPDYLYSIYICDLSPLRFAVVERIAVRFPFVSRSNGLGIHSNNSGYPFQKNYLPFERLGLPLSNCSNSLLAGLLFQNNLPEQFATNLSQNVNNSSKRCFPSLANCHGTFSAQSIFSFITLDYRYRFYSRLSYKIH